MTEKHEHGPDHQEERINALLDGDLGPQEAEALKAEAREDQRLAAAIIEAYQLQRAMDNLPVEKAPRSLSRRLRRIPRAERPLHLQPRWVLAFATVPLLAISLALLPPREPTPAQIEQARRDLSVAFAYIEGVSNRSLNRIEQELGGELKKAVATSVIRSIPTNKAQEKPA